MPMMRKMYDRLLDDLVGGNKAAPIFTQHINYVNKAHYTRDIPYEQTEPNQIVVDYIASMTDDYFVDATVPANSWGYKLFPAKLGVSFTYIIK